MNKVYGADTKLSEEFTSFGRWDIFDKIFGKYRLRVWLEYDDVHNSQMDIDNVKTFRSMEVQYHSVNDFEVSPKELEALGIDYGEFADDTFIHDTSRSAEHAPVSEVIRVMNILDAQTVNG